jgi:hypothetical protein
VSGATRRRPRRRAGRRRQTWHRRWCPITEAAQMRHAKRPDHYLCDTVEQQFTHLSSLGVKWSQVAVGRAHIGSPVCRDVLRKDRIGTALANRSPASPCRPHGPRRTGQSATSSSEELVSRRGGCSGCLLCL